MRPPLPGMPGSNPGGGGSPPPPPAPRLYLATLPIDDPAALVAALPALLKGQEVAAVLLRLKPSDPRTLIINALSPAKVNEVYLDDRGTENKTAIVVVPDRQLSLAIGKDGQNVRLAARLTGWRIDIHSDNPGNPAEIATDSINLGDSANNP